MNKWNIYQKVLIPKIPPHIEINISEKEVKELIKKIEHILQDGLVSGV